MIFPMTTVCEQDSTWADYNKDYTMMGGVFMDSCALWVVQGVEPEMTDAVAPTSKMAIRGFSPKIRTGNETAS
jgi:hypothetical protein